MRHFALIGNPLSHSFSADYFAHKFIRERILDADYRLLPLDSLENLKSVIAKHHLKGFNVTIPFKIEIIPKLDELAASVQEIGAVNCVSISNGRF